MFKEGWRCWVESDLAAFLEPLPADLRQQLIERAGRFGGEEVRGQIASFFRGWFGRLTVTTLADPEAASLAAAIIRSSPAEYLGKLRRLIEGAAVDGLLRIKGDWNGQAWGPRQTLVWLLENLVAFPDLFDDCEACLFRLALHETDRHIGDNVEGIWRNLFSIYLSGTAAPFERRIDLLRERMLSPGPDEARMAFRGLDRVFAGPSGRGVSPPEIAGRRRPDDWRPASQEEERACYLGALKLCGEHLIGGDAHRRALAFDVLVDHIDLLLRSGFLDDVAGIIAKSRLEEGETRRLMNAVDEFIGWETPVSPLRASEPLPVWTEPIRRWVESLQPSDFDGMLRTVCARQPWDRRFADDPRMGRDEADELAARIVGEPSRLRSHLDWLASHEARSAGHLGFALGRVDGGEACGEMILLHAIAKGAAPLLTGYIRGLVFAERHPTRELIRLMMEFEAAHPRMAVDILVFGGDDFDALNRVISLVELKAVPPSFLASFARGIGRRRLSAEEVSRILPYFVDALLAGDAGTARPGVSFLSWHLKVEKDRATPSALAKREVRSQAWRLVEAALPYVPSGLAYDWSEIVAQLAEYDLERAVILLGKTFLSESLEVVREARKRLIEIIPRDSGVVMEGLGQALVDSVQGWRLQAHVVRDLVSRIPSRIVLDWVGRHGIDGARAIARHLPVPYLDEEGQPVVPEVLDAVLREYDDDQVLDNFAAGVHSGESWFGDGAERCRRDVEVAGRFLRHPNRRISEWARQEIDERTRMAEWEEREHIEAAVPG